MMKTNEWEIGLGGAIRQARIRSELTVDEVAALANLASKSVRSLELGRGSTLTTLIKVLDVLGETRLLAEWIEGTKAFSPIAALRESQNRSAVPQRVRRKRGGGGAAAKAAASVNTIPEGA